METPLLLWNATHSTPVTGILIPLTPDEALNLQHALRLRAAGMMQRTRVITELAHSYTAFEIALSDLDAKLQTVLGGKSDDGGNSKPDTNII